MNMDSDKILIAPVLTEKSNTLREEGKYVFRVNPAANKIQIMLAVKETFNVHPVKCSIINVKPKPKRVRAKKGYTSSWKKAIVTLSSGEKIGIFEGA
jgi:large subunit ribosomal protein L23